MEQKTRHSKLALCAIKGIQEMEECASKGGLEESLLELVRIRTSQINECNHCKELHTGNARDRGETSRRLSELEYWRKTNHFNDREKAALAWTEAISYSSGTTDFDVLFEKTGTQLTEQELIAITIAVNAVSNWNRLSLTMRSSF